MLLREVGSFFVLVIVKNISLLTTLILLVRILSLLGKTFAGNTDLLHNCYCLWEILSFSGKTLAGNISLLQNCCCWKFSAFQEKI